MSRGIIDSRQIVQCFKPAFALFALEASGDKLLGRVCFDEFGRFIGPGKHWVASWHVRYDLWLVTEFEGHDGYELS